MPAEKYPYGFYINDAYINPRSGEVILQDKVQVLEPKLMTMLLVFVEHARSILAAETLFEQVWPGAIYSPNSVRRNIALLRKSLGDEQKQLLKTHPKRGYSLQAKVTVLSAPNGAAGKDEKITRVPTQTVVAAFIFVACLLGSIAFYGFFYTSPSPQVSTLAEQTPITSGSEQERYMRLSPNGNYMATIQSQGDYSGSHIAIYNLATKQTWRVSQDNKPYTYLAWRDDNLLLYSYKSNAGIKFGQLLLDEDYQVVTNTTLFTRRDISWNSPFFIDDEQQLYYLANRQASEHSRNTSLYQHDLISGEITTLLPPNDAFKPYKVTLSPDKSQLAILGFDGQSKSVVKLMDLATLTVNKVSELDMNWYFFTWLSHQQSLLLSDGSQLSELSLSGHWRQLPYSSYHFLQYVQVHDNQVFFIDKRADKDIFLVKRSEPESVAAISDSNMLDMYGVISTDEKKIAYMSTRNGKPQLFVKALLDHSEQLVFANKQDKLALHPPIWHNNSERLLSAANNQLFIVDTNKPNVTWLKGVIGVPIAWLRDKNSFVYIDKSAQGDWLYTYNLATSKRHALQQQLNGRQIAVNDQDQLIAVTAAGIRNLSTDALLATVTKPNLTLFPAAQGLYIRGKQDDQYSLKYIPYSGQSTVVQKDLATLCQRYCASLHSLSENYIVYTKEQYLSDIVSLEITNSR